MNILFLCTELAGYFVNCIHQLQSQYVCTITVIHYPRSKNAPFEIESTEIKMITVDTLTRKELKEMCISFQPAIVYVGGWVNKDYVAAAKALKRMGSVVIGGMDNTWKGSMRQRIASLGSRFMIKPAFSFLWVAGKKQYEYARRLGFLSSEILLGLYAADVDKFSRIAHSTMDKKLVFVGRFEPIKGIHSLVEAYKSIPHEKRMGWKLQMIGNGSLKNEIDANTDIEVYDFMQPSTLISFVAHAGGFILPSLHEPWGVVVQEFAAAGKPLLLSDQVSSGEKYLIPNFNGFQFRANDISDLRNTLVSFFALSIEERAQMGQNSYELAMQGSPKMWASTFVSVLHLKRMEEVSSLVVKS